MHFTKVRINGLSTIDFPILGALPSDPYILKNIEGLGPVEIDVSIANTLNAGGVYQGRRPQSREIVASVGLNPDFKVGQTASDLRASLYGMLTPGQTDNITIQVMNSAAIIAQTTGYVSKMEINPFSKDPEVQITIPCLQQYLQALNNLFVTPASKSAPVIANVGTAPAGFHLEVIFTAILSSWTLTYAVGQKMQLTYGFQIGDKLEIDTRPGSRGIWNTHGGIRTNLIWTMSSDSIWLMLHGGDNTFSTSSQSFNWGDVYYLPQYWGI